jgi:iron complex transport system permease protein
MINTAEKRGRWLVLVAAVMLVVVFVLSFALGKYPVPPDTLLHVLWSKLTNAAKDWPDDIELVIFKIRMPRIFAGALIGAGLSAAGAAYQGLFRNPMVSPDVLGASAGAGFGAAFSLYLGLNFAFVSVNAFICGIIAVGTAYLISTKVKQNPTLGMVLAGIMISSLFTSGTSYIKLIADPDNTLPLITYWLMGSISSIRINELVYASIPILSGMFILFLLRWKMNLVAVGEDEARSMGINTKIMRIIIVSAATMITAACVSISGMIGWVGLVIPHFSRMAVGHDYRVMLPMSMIMGAGFLMIVDNFARMLATLEIPIGILTSFVGAPFFLYLILKRGNNV